MYYCYKHEWPNIIISTYPSYNLHSKQSVMFHICFDFNLGNVNDLKLSKAHILLWVFYEAFVTNFVNYNKIYEFLIWHSSFKCRMFS
jgi:hypothetical protein